MSLSLLLHTAHKVRILKKGGGERENKKREEYKTSSISCRNFATSDAEAEDEDDDEKGNGEGEGEFSGEGVSNDKEEEDEDEEE